MNYRKQFMTESQVHAKFAEIDPENRYLLDEIKSLHVLDKANNVLYLALPKWRVSSYANIQFLHQFGNFAKQIPRGGFIAFYTPIFGVAFSFNSLHQEGVDRATGVRIMWGKPKGVSSNFYAHSSKRKFEIYHKALDGQAESTPA